MTSNFMASCLPSTAESQFLFYANATRVMFVSTNGGPSTTLLASSNPKLGYDPVTRQLFVYDSIHGTLSTMVLDGSDQQVAFTRETIDRFTVDDSKQKIYYLAKSTEYAKSINYDGTSSKTLVGDGFSDFSDIQVDSTNQ